MCGASTLARRLDTAALTFCFLAFGLWELVDPSYWTAYLPHGIDTSAAAVPLVFVHGIILSVCGIGVMTNRWMTLWLGLSTALLLEVTVTVWFVIGYGDVFIRDVSLTLFAAAMLARHRAACADQKRK